MKQTLSIAYPPGAYGTYLEWLLRALITNDEINSPFTEFGNSHGSKFKRMAFIDSFQQYIETSDWLPVVRFHPKTKADHSIKENLEYVLDHTDRLILLYPDRLQQLACVCNFMTKVVPGSHHYDGVMNYINREDICKGYNIDPGTDLRTIPLWIQREHMSFNLFDAWHDQVEWYFPDTWNHPRAMIITTRQLIEEFETVMDSIQDFWTTQSFIRPISDLKPYHVEMTALQPHLEKDHICSRIIKTTIETNDNEDYGNLCLVSQAWIQYQLRIKGYEIKCDGLEVFPASTDHLRSLIYPN